MAISWGSWYTTPGYQQWRIGIDAWIEGVTVYYNVYTQALGSVSDTQAYYWDHGSRTLTVNLPSGGELRVNDGTVSFGGSRGSSYTINAHLDRGTVYAGGRPYNDPWHAVSVNIPALAPNTPGIASLSNITASNIRVTGAIPNNNGSSISSWEFQRSTSSNMSGAVSETNNGHIYDMGGLARATTYYFRVRCRNAVGWSGWSAVSSATTLQAVPSKPSAPTLVSSGSTTASIGRGTSSDNGGSAITGNQLQVSTNSSFTGLVYNATALTSPVNLSGLSSATTYWARNRTQNSFGWSSWSNTLQFSTGALAPSAPSTPSVSSITQTSAQVQWSAPFNGGSTITGYDLQVATNSSFSSGLQTFSVTTLSRTLALSPGTDYWTRVRAKNAVGNSPYSSSRQFTTVSGKPSIVPMTTRTDGRAGGIVRATGWANSFTITMERATNSSFSSDYQVITKTFASADPSGLYIIEWPGIQPNGTYYLRARVKNNVTGYESEWSDTASYVQLHTPSSTGVSPTGDSHIQYQSSTPMVFEFADSAIWSGDRISAYQIQVSRNDTGASVADTGKVSRSNADTLQTVNVSISSSYKNIRLRWRSRVWDSVDQASAWSGYNLFTPADLPVVTISSPANGSNVSSGNPTIEWSLTIPSGGTQASASVVVREMESSAIVWQRNVSGSTTSVTPPSVILLNGKTYVITVTSTDTNGLSGSSVSQVNVAYESPSAIDFHVFASFNFVDENGYVLLDWSEAEPDERIQQWVVYRRDAGTEGDWTTIARIDNVGARSYKDWSATSGSVYEYSVVQVVDRFGVPIESPVGYVTSGLDTRQYEVRMSHYWLIVESDESMSMMLPHVTGHETSEEYEEATINVIGRGRRREHGERWGFTGTLSLQFRGPEARRKRLKLHEIRTRGDRYLLKTPFGDMYPIALGNPSVTYLPGTGLMEMTDVSIDYEEVY